ncbi:MAG: phosphodiester glycosidase family protein [Iphinoe sp. HA4291-MV1]|nr:phosphodiester glycosidase family protein [Iphinoe sp. HA4291-MV1]
MGEIPTFCQNHHSATVNKGNGRHVVVFVSPIILTLLCLIATCMNAKAQFLLETDNGTQRHKRDTGTHKHGEKETYPRLRISQQQFPQRREFPSQSLLEQPLPPPPALSGVISYGNKISLNGRILSGAWLQQRGKTGSLSIHLSDAAVRQLFGVDLLNSSNPDRQPIQWFSSNTKPLVLTSLLATGYRYLDITNFAQAAKWQMQVVNNTLVITTPSAKVTNISQDKQLAVHHIIVDLDRPTPWQITQGLSVKKPQPQIEEEGNSSKQLPSSLPHSSSLPDREWIITLDGIADPVLVQRYTPPRGAGEQGSRGDVGAASPTGEESTSTGSFPPIPLSPHLPISPSSSSPSSLPLIQQMEVVNNQTIMRLSVPFGFTPRISTVPNPNRLIIEIRPDAMVERNITWAPGLNWRQRFVNLGKERFPIVWLEISPRTSGIKLKPIWTMTNTLVGTAPLVQTALAHSAVAAINGGYFNRNNQLPLGAIRRDGLWLSSPILNRGAIAWNDSGQFYIGRLNLLETLIGNNNVQLPILTLNSGYVQSGIARYTAAWGATYTPLTDNEIILVVQKNQVMNQQTGGKAGEITVPIPQDSYLLILRGNATSNGAILPIGSSVRIASSTAPAVFSRYPHIVGAGPLLLQNRQIVLDAKSEKFSNAFITQKAIRSGICTTTTGNLIIAAVHNRAGGAGPTLAEHAQLMQLLGCVDALNLDGGSSTSLYLGGQLLDRSPNTAARVHNGIGIFLPPLQSPSVKSPKSKAINLNP